MSFEYSLFLRDDCLPCTETPDPCPVCSPDETCQQTARDCNTCPVNQCVPKPGKNSGSSTSSGVSKGALAGAVIGVLLFLAVAVSLFLWYRKTSRFRSATHIAPASTKDIPASAETVLNRPDPTEKSIHTPENSVRVFSTTSNTTIDLDPETQRGSTHGPARASSVMSNPFEDGKSIQTTGSEGTNVIPIALVSPDAESTTSDGPVRPVRSPELTLNYDHVNVSGDSMQPPAGYARSQVSGISGVSSRNSYLSNASYSSDFLNEAPMIMTANKGAVKQVLGVVKPEVISANSLSPTVSEGLKPPSFSKRPSVGSPLASGSFGPLDMAKDSDDGHGDPFDDKHCSTVTNLASPAASVATFGQPSPAPTSTVAQWGTPTVPHVSDDDHSRPSSMLTQAGSVIGIENATRVHLGMSYASDETPRTSGFPRPPYRTTMGKLVSPSTAAATAGSLEEQQQKALAHAQAQDPGRRISQSSVLSSASTRADSILESFPFVPPSPISNRPMRTPPVSPLVQQTFGTSTAPSSPLAKQSFTKDPSRAESPLPPPPNRRTLGMSTGSQFSTASSGLGSFPFQIESGNFNEPASAALFNGRQRASLDTLAITSDITSYPLGFDKRE